MDKKVETTQVINEVKITHDAPADFKIGKPYSIGFQITNDKGDLGIANFIFKKPWKDSDLKEIMFYSMAQTGGKILEIHITFTDYKPN